MMSIDYVVFKFTCFQSYVYQSILHGSRYKKRKNSSQIPVTYSSSENAGILTWGDLSPVKIPAWPFLGILLEFP